MKILAFSLAAIVCLLCPQAVAKDKINVYGISFNEGLFNTVFPLISDQLDVDLVYRPLDLPYADNIELELIYNPSVDIANLLTPSITRIDEANWLQDLSAFPEIVQAADLHYDHVKSALYQDGKLLGLGYGAIIQHMPLVDIEAYKKLGLSRRDFPRDWHALHEQMIQLAQQGHRNFFYPAWHRSEPGLALSFLVEVWNRGGHIVDPQSPEIELDLHSGPAFETLQDWRRVWASGAIPSELLEKNFSEFREACIANNYAISVQSSEMLLLPYRGHLEKRNISPLPRASQNWGTLVSLISSIARREGQSEADQELLRLALYSISHGQGSGAFAFAGLALKNDGLLSVYKDFMRSGAARNIMSQKLARKADVDVLLRLYENGEVPDLFWKSVWHEEFADFLHVELKHYLQNPAIEPQRIISRMNQKLDELKTSYGY